MEFSSQNTFWQINVLGNSLSAYFGAFGLFLLLILLLYIFRMFLLKQFKAFTQKTTSEIDDVVYAVFQSIQLPFYSVVACYLAVSTLNIPRFYSNGLTGILIIISTIQTILVLQIIIDYFIKRHLIKEKNTETADAYNIVGKISKGILWVLGLFFVLSNMGINITSLIAGLGIGGVAVAFALQNILGDLFSSFAIYFDKPFIAGDFIVVGDKMGVVEKIGIKTTRIRALQGEEIVIPNQQLTSANIQNFKKMQERRIVFTFSIMYETPPAKIKKIPQIVKKIIEENKQTKFDRAHFSSFADSALLFEVVYYVTTSDYTIYMDIQQKINFSILEVFQKEHISMAYPTRTLHLIQEQTK